jgi:membrane associated rhomboid family serine protease
MLIVPHLGRMSWKNPPYLTLILILINALIYFAFQADEGKYYRQADKYYQSSGLISIENTAYLNYLEESDPDRKLARLRALPPEKPATRESIAESMFADQPFMQKLKAEEIITPAAEIYPEWKRLRTEFEEIIGRAPTMRYGYKPAQNRFLTAFTYMFLHGSPMHLLGNMIFLWLVGCMIELTCGRPIYLATYLATGMFSALFFGMVYSDSTIPLVGASGAISGLMGFYAMLFSRKKVGIFLSLGFYFTNTTVPAILLLPFWVGKELYQLFLGAASNVAYVGHLGGLLSGALAGVVYWKAFGGLPEDSDEQGREARLANLQEEGLRKLADLEFAEARQLFAKILAEEPKNLKALRQLFQIDNQNPEQGDCHTSADRLFALLARNPAAEEDCVELYRQYLEKAKSPLLSANSSLAINRILLKKGYLKESAAIIGFLLKKHPHLPELPVSLLNLAKGYLRLDGGLANAGKCLQLICKHYPNSPESVPARAILEKSQAS